LKYEESTFNQFIYKWQFSKSYTLFKQICYLCLCFKEMIFAKPNYDNFLTIFLPSSFLSLNCFWPIRKEWKRKLPQYLSQIIVQISLCLFYTHFLVLFYKKKSKFRERLSFYLLFSNKILFWLSSLLIKIQFLKWIN